ncbi:MAG: methylmalonyl-CoA carboxyltransferase, partial [Thermoleophilia bacterium]|nr:methylmalonyl-CoA carboxyltransferase [Thermoleophilia bacterium]
MSNENAPEAGAPAETDAQSIMLKLIDDLNERRAHNMMGGGQAKIDKQHERGKLTARERLTLLVDDGSWVEMGLHGRPHFSQKTLEGVDAPADGVVAGYGKVDGRPVCVAAYDFTVLAGSMGLTGEIKLSRLRAL